MKGNAPVKLIGEALLVAAAGIALALAANALSPRGLSLSRDYFPETAVSAPGRIPANGSSAATGGEVNTVDPALIARIRGDGLKLIDTDQALKMYRDPRYSQELIVFVDARDDEHYEQGHIPGAFQFDRYHPEKYLPAVLTACLAAEQVVVYCTGGECEDSEFAAVTLKQAAIPAGKISVYGGGYTEWSAKHLPLETGARGSGQIVNGTP